MQKERKKAAQIPRQRQDMNQLACSVSSSSLSPRSPIVCRFPPATTGLSCDFLLDAVADDHPIVTDTNTTTTPVSAPPVHCRTARVLENNARCIHGVDCIDMTRLDEDELFHSGNGSGGGPSPSAFAAVSHYPYVEPGESERLAMNEVINVHAVVGNERLPNEVYHRGGAPGGRERDYAVEDVAMRSLASSDREFEDDDEEEEGEEEDPDDSRKLYPDAVARNGDEVPDGGVSLTGDMISDVGYVPYWDEHGNIRYQEADRYYEDEDYAHEDEDVLGEEDDQDDEADEEAAHEQHVMDTLNRMDEISHRALQAGVDIAQTNPLEMADILADFANEFPVTSMWPKSKCNAEKANTHPLQHQTCMN